MIPDREVLLPILSSPLIDNNKVDCSFCRAPCCTMAVSLMSDEVDKYSHYISDLGNGPVPVLAMRDDSYCVYYVEGKGCSTYEDKPFVCTVYTCEGDKRINLANKYSK